MTLAELIAEVYLITNRPDLVAITTAAVKSATLKAHNSDFYNYDIHETGITWPSAEFRQSFDIPGLLSNFRAMRYLRKAESATDETGIFFTVIETEEILDSYGINRVDIAYMAGRVLEIRSSTEFQFALLAVYLLPIVTDGAYASWVADIHPYAIIHEAARNVFIAIGKREEAIQQGNLTVEVYIELRSTGVATVGM